jgi:hypothetical protein
MADDAGSGSDGPDDEMDAVRQALDYSTSEALDEVAQKEDRELVETFEQRLDDADLDDVEEGSVTAQTIAEESGEDDDAEADDVDESDHTEPEDSPVEADDEGHEAASEPGRSEPLGQRAEQALEASGSDWSSAPEDNGHEPDDGSVYGGLNEFTVVAPPQGSIRGDWAIVNPDQDEPEPGLDEDLALEDEPLDDEELSLEDQDLSLDDEPEEEALEEDEVPAWPEEEEGLLEDEDDEEVVDAEAEPEQDEELWADLLDEEDEDEEVEVVDEDPDDEDLFEDADEWLGEETDPGSEEAQEEREEWIDESLEAEEEADEDDIDDLLAGIDEDDEDQEELTFEAAGGSSAEAEEDEVEFAVAEDDDDEANGGTVQDGNPASNPERQEWIDESLEADDEPAAEDYVEGAGEPEDEEVVDPPETDSGEDAYTHGPYTLYHKTVATGSGDERDLYFFARNPPDDASPATLPDDYDVGVNDRTGVPFVREQNDHGEDEA